MGNQKLQTDLDAANLRIRELKLDFKAMRSEAMRLQAEVLQVAEEVEKLSDMNQLLRSQLAGLAADKDKSDE